MVSHSPLNILLFWMPLSTAAVFGLNRKSMTFISVSPFVMLDPCSTLPAEN
jgi:hypothetical protein